MTRFTALGDSITLGVGDPVRVPGQRMTWRGWAALLAEGLQEPQLHILAGNGALATDIERDQLPRALELRPDHPLLWLFAGRCQKELGLVGPARQSFQQALQLDPRLHQAARAISSLSETSLVTRLGGWWKYRFRA